jgi:hypothetical protein
VSDATVMSLIGRAVECVTGSVRNEMNLMRRIRVVSVGRSVVMNVVGGCRSGLLNLGSGVKKASGGKIAVAVRGLTLGSVVRVLRSGLLPQPNASVNVEKKVSVPRIVVVALGQISGSWIVNVRVVVGIAAAQRGGARGLRGSSAVGWLKQRTGLGTGTRKRFVVGIGAKGRKPISGSWIVNVQNAVNADSGVARVVAVVWRKRLKGLGTGARSQSVVGTVRRGL